MSKFVQQHQTTIICEYCLCNLPSTTPCSIERHGLSAKKKGGSQRRAQTPASTRTRPPSLCIKLQRRAQTADGGRRTRKKQKQKQKDPTSLPSTSGSDSSKSARRLRTREDYRRTAQQLWRASHVGPSSTHTNNLHCARLLARLPGQIADSKTTQIKTMQKNVYGFERDQGFRRAQLLWNGSKKPKKPVKKRGKERAPPPSRRRVVVTTLLTRMFDEGR